MATAPFATPALKPYPVIPLVGQALSPFSQ